MRHPTRNLKADFRPDDGAKLAQLFNESGEGWPGGQHRDDFTPEEGERWAREEDRAVMAVAEADGRMVATCDLEAKPGARSAYVAYLNAHPAYHGRGYGKAVLLRCVEEAMALGYDRVTLYTWPGNLKAVPLYKKTGFMWAPETGVRMENMLPTALRHPLAQPFFERHDWYETLVRDLSLQEDLYYHGKVRAYEYRWQAGEDLLRLVFDRQSWGLLEIETNDLRVGCCLPEEKIVADIPQQICWEIESKTGRELAVAIMAQPDPGISCSFAESFSVRGRELRRAEFRVDPEIKAKEREPYAQVIRSLLLIDGQPLELAAGMEVRQAAYVGVEPGAETLRPGKRQRILLRVQSSLDEAATAQVTLCELRGAAARRQTATLELPARSAAQFPVILRAGEPGQVDLRLQVSLQAGDRSVRAKDARLALRTLGPADLAASLDEDSLVLDSQALRVQLGLRGGMAVYDRTRPEGQGRLPRMLHCWGPGLGPPFGWEEFTTRKLEGAVEQLPGAVVGVVRGESATRPGVMLERRVVLTQGPVIEIRDIIRNAGQKSYDLAIMRGARPGEVRDRRAIGRNEGLREARSDGAGLDLATLRPPEAGETWPEGWDCCYRDDGLTVGLIWDQATRVEAHGFGLQQRLGRLQPGGELKAPPLYLFAGSGGPVAVRYWWQKLCGEVKQANWPTPQPSPALEVGLEPSPAVITRQGWQGQVYARSVGERRLTGQLRLSLPAGLQAQRRSFPVKELTAAQPLAAPVQVQLRAGARPGMHLGQVELQLEEITLARPAPMLVLGAAARVREACQDGLWSVEAGEMALAVAPAFCGAAVSLTWQGKELLHCAYPQPRPFIWWNPWFGGIQPTLERHSGLNDLLHKETFEARAVTRKGRSGVAWRGIAVTCSPQHEHARDIRLTVEYLLLPGAPLLAVVVEGANRWAAGTNFGIGAQVWLSLGATPKEMVLVRQASEPGVTRRRTDRRASVGFDPWGLAWDEATGRALLVACGWPEDGHAGLELTSRDGYHLPLRLSGYLGAGETRRASYYLAVGHRPQEVEPYRWLAGCNELP